MASYDAELLFAYWIELVTGLSYKKRKNKIYKNKKGINKRFSGKKRLKSLKKIKKIFDKKK